MSAASKAGGLARLRRRLVIEAPVETPDGAGGVERSFAPFGALWGQVEWQRGEERWLASRPEQAGSIRITCRARSGLHAGMRFRDGERCYDIKALGDPEGDGRRLVCLCEEVNP
jgi:SPP1 family predicted phage head-tail adaptor